MKPQDIHDEWLSLIEVSGPFLATPVLKRVFSTGLPAAEPRIRQYLRQAYDEWCEARDNDDPRFAELHRAWIHEVLARGLEYDESDSGEYLLRGERIPAELRVTLPEHGVTLVPDYALVSGDKSQLLVQIYPAGTDLQTALKIDGWIASPAERMERLCRASGCRLGLVTDGERWMLVDAPVGAVATFASWYARLWGQERLTLQAFLTLLGIRRYFGPDDETLASMLDDSLQHQEEVTDALGEQVRRAVEVLIQALDKEDRERSRTLLQGVDPTELYEAGLTIMMRLVFLLSAEERGLLLMGEEAYESNYAISTLRMQLRQETEEVLERRNDAWARLLATFRSVYGGIEHETLRLPALGGSLFDPDRFPFLEGRTKGSDWKVDPARPLPIDNRTVLLLLNAIQQYEGRTLSYRALDVEQIGYVYEGLLERTVARTERVTVELTGGKDAKKTHYGLEELEALYRRGDEVLIKSLCGSDAIKRGAGAIRKDLESLVQADQANRLLTACAGDEELRDRALPFLNLLRTDPWDYPLIYPKGAFVVITGSDRRETGTHYTPKSLTESIVETTLEPVAYVGPAEGLPREQWSLKSAAELLDLKICDPAMGSGAFLVQVCRWLAERIVEAWAEVEAAGRRITSDGVAVDDLLSLEGLPVNLEERLVIARRLVAERCLYGVDLNPLAVELAKLSIWLVTLAKGRPFGFLDHNLKCGDSLLGIHRLDQLSELSMTPGCKGQQRLFGKSIMQAVNAAIELRQRLREMPIRDIHDVEMMACLDADSRCRLEVLDQIADALIGEVLAAGGRQAALDRGLATLTIQAELAISGDRNATIDLVQRASSKLLVDGSFGKARRRPFHWPLRYPEVFAREQPGFDAIIGNPPFLGGRQLYSVLGEQHQKYLQIIYGAENNTVDLVCFFFRMADKVLRDVGCFGLLSTNSISDTENRFFALDPLLLMEYKIIYALSPIRWLGSANVDTCFLLLSRRKWAGVVVLNREVVENISSRLSSTFDASSVKRLVSPIPYSEGTKLYGKAFVKSREDFDFIGDDNPGLNYYLRRYVNGDVLNGKAAAARDELYVVDFGELEKDQICGCDDFIQNLIEKVADERKNQTRQIHEFRPWLHWDKRTRFYELARSKERIIATVIVSTHLIFQFVSPKECFSHGLKLFLDDRSSMLGILQSSVHYWWASSVSSSFRTYVRYSTSTSFDTFPFLTSSLESKEIGEVAEKLVAYRQEVALADGIGLTELYNKIHDPEIMDQEIEILRSLHCELDQSVVDSYGWGELLLSHSFCNTEQGLRFTMSETARLDVLQRLASLNNQLYKEGQVQGSPRKAAIPRVSRPHSALTESATQRGLDFGESKDRL
ncbi:hypothetical protein ALQ32_03853 [Pseudomonas syringae pv. tagetis]|uniref:site-specific DNA-methyltransferase (adenine-specific) n=1 Tax=Pseudomonas syringae pv. tagetis TaxID=129140 RepID=A0A3M3YVV0_9PSED|nr:DNA methyltransferase [Pseudomonas syringae group genomosp. 7]RMO85603.1 hypothetical protein ALQ32_03853 [Pseudomonas syringae pv. tagetis]